MALEPKGNYTQIPNELLDRWLPQLSGAELKVLLYLARRTYGFHREEVEIGMRKISSGFSGKDSGTGLHFETVSSAVHSLVKKGILKCVPGPRGRITYSINLAPPDERDCTENPISDCTENPISDCTENPISDCTENPITNKERSSSKKERKKPSERKRRRAAASSVVEGLSETQSSAAGERESSVLAFPKRPNLISSNSDDDDSEKAAREPGETPEQEFLLRLRERHGDKLDSEKVLGDVNRELLIGNVPMAEFLEADRAATSNPKALSNPHGHYRALARKLVKQGAMEARLRFTPRFASAVQPSRDGYQCPKCGSFDRGRGALLIDRKFVPCECASEEYIQSLTSKGLWSTPGDVKVSALGPDHREPIGGGK